jgi:uncharacterized protein (DUF885 family)
MPRPRILVSLAGVLVLAAAVLIVPTVWLRPWSINHLYARIFLEFALRHPTLLTRIGMPGLDLKGGELDDLSVAATRREASWTERQLGTLRSYDRAGMVPAQRTSAEVLDWFLGDQVEGHQFLFMDYPVNQFAGVQSELPAFMIGSHPLRTRREAENYLRRIARFGAAFDQMIEGLRLREQREFTPPRFVITRVLAQTRAFIAVPPAQHALYTNFADKIGSARGVGEAQRNEMLGRLERGIRTVVYPAYGRLIDVLAALEPTASTRDGVWGLPGGDAWYAHLLRSHTTTRMSADQIHALGLKEVARIQAEMRVILVSQGRDARDLGAALQRLGKEPRFLYPADDSGRAQILADYRAILEDADRRVDSLFDVRPKSHLRVQAVPAFMQATSAAAYYEPGALDGSRPGTFFANLRDPAETPRWSMRTLAYHEGIPGHHFQISIAQELTGLPMFRRFVPFTAYTEGWGLYAEQLALEHDFERDPFDRLGALNAELFRAARLVVDTGIHRMRWTREQAIEYMLRNTGVPESKIVSEVERYIVMPGQACAYKVGELEILALRQRAMDRLGARFDLKRFHHVVLTNGAVPLTILERLVEDWIRSGEGSRPAAGSSTDAPRAPRS